MMFLLLTCKTLSLLLRTQRQSSEKFNGMDFLLAIVISSLLIILLILPAFYLMKKYKFKDIIDGSLQTWGKCGRIVPILMSILFCIISIDILCRFELFITMVFYPKFHSFYVLIFLIIVGLYATLTGIEAISRANTIIFITFILSLMFIGTALIPHYNLYHLNTLFYDGVTPTINYIRSIISLFSDEIILLTVLSSKVNDNLKKAFFMFIIANIVTSCGLAFVMTASLGNFASTQMFPYFSVFSIAEFYVFEKLDSIFMMTWTAMSVIKICVYAYAGIYSLKQIKFFKHQIITIAYFAVIAITSCIATFDADSIITNLIQKFLTSFTPLIIFLIIIPLAMLITQKFKNQIKEKEILNR
jgi:spore germination protein KB